MAQCSRCISFVTLFTASLFALALMTPPSAHADWTGSIKSEKPSGQAVKEGWAVDDMPYPTINISSFPQLRFVGHGSLEVTTLQPMAEEETNVAHGYLLIRIGFTAALAPRVFVCAPDPTPGMAGDSNGNGECALDLQDEDGDGIVNELVVYYDSGALPPSTALTVDMRGAWLSKAGVTNGSWTGERQRGKLIFEVVTD